MGEIVWLHEERTFAELISMGAFYSLVRYTHGGNDYEVLVSNDEYDYWEDDSDDED